MNSLPLVGRTWTSALLIVAGASGVVSCSGRRGPVPAADVRSAQVEPLQAFLDAFREERYDDALAKIDEVLESSPLDGASHSYRATCLAMMGRYEDAVEGFRRGEIGAPGFLDRTVLYLRALSLYHVGVFGRSREVLDVLARSFPQSQASEKGQDLAIRIESRLAEGIERSNLNWYLERGLAMQAAARPALAVEYLEEYLLLAARAGDAEAVRNPGARLALGASYLELASPGEALRHLERVPPSEGDYRASLFLALARHSGGDTTRAIELLTEAAQGTSTPSVRQRAEALAKGMVGPR